MEQKGRRKPVGIPNREVGEDLAESVRPAAAPPGLTAYAFRDELQGMLGWTDDELRQLPIVYGSELEAREIYLDLDHPERGEFRATDEVTINPGCRYVPKRRVPEADWYRLATSLGRGEIPHGKAAATPGAFGQPNPGDITLSPFSGTFPREGGEGLEEEGQKRQAGGGEQQG